MSSLYTRHTPLNTGWQVRELESRGTSEASDLPWLPAHVPGHIHLDLMRAGVLTDPFYRLEERSASWVDESDWVYETTFDLEDQPAGSTYLVFHGLDTISEITLNGDLLGSTDNMFVPHEFKVAGKLRTGKGSAGENRLRVVFRSALRVGRERQKAWAEEGNDTLAPHWFVWGPRSFVRKAQYMYGWDWGPELISCGIWRPVELVQVPVARLLDWKYEVEFASAERAVVHLTASVERTAGDSQLTLKASFPPPLNYSVSSDAIAAASATVSAGEGCSRVTLSIPIENPRLWWPNGHPGSLRSSRPSQDLSFSRFQPYLYRMDLSLYAGEGDGERIDSKQASIGLRTIELVREADEDGKGESFLFRVNGEPIFMKGANWIPADSFPARLAQDNDIYRDACMWPQEEDHRVYLLLHAAAEAGFNMLRVWGGGLYESEQFYQTCDELGILVWQDFPYGCAYYPDTGAYAEAAGREAIAAVRRLRVHPSLALWCGNNENHQMHHDGWAGKDNTPPRYLGEKLYHEVLPAVLEAEDPGRPYWPSSPYGGETPNSQEYGDRHDWDVWHGVGDWIHYPEDNSRFVSEFGFASSCGLTAWNKCLAAGDRSPYSAAVRWHEKTRKGYDTYLGYIALHFPVPNSLEDLVYYSQLNQAEALKCGLEHWRRRKGRCWGLLFWQLNDCWPVQSWAIIDSEGEPKASYYAVKKAYAPVLLSLVRRDGSVEAHLTNDLPLALTGTVNLALRTLEGELVAEEKGQASVQANDACPVASLDLSAANGRERSLYVDARFSPQEETLKAVESAMGDCRIAITQNLLFLAEPRDLCLADPGLRIEVSEQDEQWFTVTLSTQRLAPYVWLRVTGKEGWSHHEDWNDNFFHLRPGERRCLMLGKSDLLKTTADVIGRLRVRTL